jgi:hypothetical protein
MSNKKTFAVDGKEYAVVKPSHKVMQTATLTYNREFRKAVEAGLLVRAKIDQVMREQNLWDDAKQKKYEDVVKSLLAGEKKLAEGGIKLSEAKSIAMKMREDRAEMRSLNGSRNELDQHTAEAQAEQARFNYLVSTCTVYGETGKPYFKDVEDYLTKEEDPVVLPAAQNMGKLIYGLEDDYEKKLPENKFLLRYKFVDEELRLVNKDGKLIDLEGRLLDDKGRLINEKGELIDTEGNLLTEDGEYKVDFVEFVDDVYAAAPVKAEKEDKVEKVEKVEKQPFTIE